MSPGAGAREPAPAYRIGEIHTSPYLRCVQTVEPLAAALDLQPLIRAELSRSDKDATATHSCASSLIATRWCAAMAASTARSEGAPKWRKGAAFVLDRDLRFVEQI